MAPTWRIPVGELLAAPVCCRRTGSHALTSTIPRFRVHPGRRIAACLVEAIASVPHRIDHSLGSHQTTDAGAGMLEP
jgi:hypothetical protein